MLDIGSILQKFGIEYLGRYYSSYRGVVVSNKDPDNTGKILVYVPSVQSGIKVWARSKSWIGNLKSGVKFLAPNPGEVVWVEFEKGSPLNAIWSYHGWSLKEVPEELKDNNTFGIVTPKGNKIIFSEKDNKLSISVGVEDKTTTIVIDNDTMEIDNKEITLNGGKNKGLVNSDAIRSLAQALMKDLLVLGSGTNLSTWMGNDMINKLEDNKVKH